MDRHTERIKRDEQMKGGGTYTTASVLCRQAVGQSGSRAVEQVGSRADRRTIRVSLFTVVGCYK
jgi:hypothetical protein